LTNAETTYLRFNYFQIPHLDPTCREIRYLKLHTDRPLPLRSTPNPAHTSTKPTRHPATVLIVTFYRGETQLGAHQELLGAAELLDLPDDGGLFGRVVHGADICAEPWRVGVFGNGDQDLDVVGCAAALELCFCLVG